MIQNCYIILQGFTIVNKSTESLPKKGRDI